MTLKAVLIDPATGVAIEVIDDIFGHPNLAVTDHYPSSTRFRSSTRTGAGTTTIAEPAIDGAIMLTDMIISTDRVALSRLTVFFDDGTRQIDIFDGYANDNTLNLAIAFHGGWTGWMDAALKMTTVAALNATVAIGYIKLGEGLNYTEWDALR